MKNKNNSKTDFTNVNEVKKLIVANEIIHSNWMSGKPLVNGVEEYKKSNPEDFKELMRAYDSMNKAFVILL